jgi:metal-responsive CopG/Arc/MetJ family transcriptional regulator
MKKRVRITVSLPAELVDNLDRTRKKGVSRSRHFEEKLLEGEKILERRALEKEIRDYYAVPPTAEEKAFTRALGRISRKLVIDEPAQKRRGG